VLVAIATISHPFRVFRATLAGLQDATFTGALAVGQSVASVATTIVLLTQGYGLFALALGSGAPSFVTNVIAIARLRAIAPDLMRGWTRPTLMDVRVLLTNGTGVWLGGMDGSFWPPPTPSSSAISAILNGCRCTAAPPSWVR
jgi:hypothetical protein